MINITLQVLAKEDYLKFAIILLLIFLTFFLEFISLGSIPIFVGLIIDSSSTLSKLEEYGIFYFSEFNNENLIKYIGVIIIAIFIIKNVFYFALIYIQGKFIKNFKLTLARKLLNFYVGSPFSYHMEHNPAELTRNSTDNVDFVSEFILQEINLFKESIAILVIFILLLFLNPVITLSITFIFSLFSFWYLRVIKPSLKKKAKQSESLKTNLIKIVNESFGAIKDIKLLNKEKNILKYYDANREKVEDNAFFFNLSAKSPKLLLESIAIIAITLSTLIILNFNEDVLGLLPILSLIVIATVRFIPAFNGIITSLFYLRIYRPYGETIIEEMKQMKYYKKKSPIILEDKLARDINIDVNKNLILLKDISFSYKDDQKDILKNINFSIEKGTIVGITGETGSGKSTLFHIMLGLLLPKNGMVFYKNKNIHADIVNWRNKIGYVDQNIYLLDNTIEKNITFDFLEEKTDKEKIDFAIKMSSLDEKISELPHGLETIVGNNGMRLSGGEKQRVALARAIYRNPNIYFMDESTSALDANTEQKIIKNMKENFSQKTIILIAHRKTTIDACDKIINLKNGYIN
jgi:ABC-type multidrug transport system fused ATPase/permease subunit